MKHFTWSFQNKAIRIFSFILLPLLSCVTTRTNIAEYKIVPIENPGNLSTITITPNVGREDGFCFKVKNDGSDAVLIDWDNSYIVVNSKTYRCIHSGIRFLEKSAPQAKTPLASGSEISDCLFPESNIEINNVYAGWIQKPLDAGNGEYSIAIIHNGKQENIKGTFSMMVKDNTIPMHNMSSTNSAITTLYLLSGVLLILSGVILLL